MPTRWPAVPVPWSAAARPASQPGHAWRALRPRRGEVPAAVGQQVGAARTPCPRARGQGRSLVDWAMGGLALELTAGGHGARLVHGEQRAMEREPGEVRGSGEASEAL
jgi:hypothetical protein